MARVSPWIWVTSAAVCCALTFSAPAYAGAAPASAATTTSSPSLDRPAVARARQPNPQPEQDAAPAAPPAAPQSAAGETARPPDDSQPLQEREQQPEQQSGQEPEQQPAPQAAAPQPSPADPPQAANSQPANPPPANPSADNPQPDAPQIRDTEQTRGPFRVGGVGYTVVLREKMLVPPPSAAGKPAPPAPPVAAAPGGKFRITLAAMEIDDASGDVVYQDSFPFGVTEGQFTQRVTATPYLFAGHGGSAIVIHYSEESPEGRAPESWQVFGLVNGELAPFGPPLPLGQGGGIAVGGVVAGVMVKNGISVVPLASTADELEFRAWEGHFSIDVPVRVDWMAGQWGQGQECFELGDGDLRPKGCNLRVEGVAQGRGDQTGYVQLFAATDGDARNAEQVMVRPDSQVDFVEARAMVTWTAAEGDRIACGFADVWLHVRIDGKDGWVTGDNDFAALGLPASPPPQ